MRARAAVGLMLLALGGLAIAGEAGARPGSAAGEPVVLTTGQAIARTAPAPAVSTPVPTPWVRPPPHGRTPMPFTPAMVGGFALIVLGASFFWMEVHATSHGAFGVAGALCVIAGLAFIFGYTTLAISLSWSAVGPLAILALVAMAWSFYKGVKHMEETPLGDLREHVGKVVRASGPLLPAGKVELEGSFWNAVCTRPVPAGTLVRILGADGLTLRVEPVEGPPA